VGLRNAKRVLVVIAAHSVSYHQYADDTQLYVALQPNTNATFKPISECTDDVNRWFLENKLLLNPSKTEAMLCGTQVQCDKVNWWSGSCRHCCQIWRYCQAAWCQARSIHQYESSLNPVGVKL